MEHVNSFLAMTVQSQLTKRLKIIHDINFTLINYDCWAYPVFVFGGNHSPLSARFYIFY